MSPGAAPGDITVGPNGALWFAEYGVSRIAQITTSGVITEYSTGISPGANPLGITYGPDGNLWFTEYTGNRIGRITPLGVVTEFSTGISAGANPGGITAGVDGNLWFTEGNGNRIGRITTSGVITEFNVGISPGAFPRSITSGPDGNLWFTETSGNRIARLTRSDGVVTEFSVGISANADPWGITAGPDGALWFTEASGSRIGRITTGAAAPAFVSAVSRKVHGSAGTFDLPLSSVATNPSTEPRRGPAHTIVFTFDKPPSAASVTITEGAASAGSPTFSGNDILVDLTNVIDQQYATVGLQNIASSDGGAGGSASMRIGFLVGDVNQNRVVTVADLGLVNAQLAQVVTAANYLKDVNASGTLTVADKGITNASLTKALPAP